MRALSSLIVVVAICLGLMLPARPAQAQFGDLKNKLKEKAQKKGEEKAGQMINKSSSDTTETTGSGEQEKEAAQPAEKGKGGTASGAAGGTGTSEDMTLYTKYDFVPGDNVIFYDDLANEEIGEFPSRWKLDSGVFEVAKQGNENYIMCTNSGYIRPKIAPAPLPPKYTVEMEFYSKGPELRGHWFYIEWMDAEDAQIARLAMTDNEHTSFTIGDNELANKQLPAPLAPGKHTMRIMATASSIKCYIDNERVANVPAVEGFAPVGFRVQMDPYLDEPGNPMLMRGFRFAEGGKTMKEQLDETGRVVTHGILFDSGSDKIKAESYKTLADIAQLLTGNPDLRLSIEGHTDNDGADDYNMKLSESRAKSVKSYLVATYKIDGARLETKGWGESKPIDTNDTAEGKANNRRVELVKL
jgi:OOP family OmpA-OmpF porin